MRGRRPWRRSLLLRLLTVSVLIAVCSIAATAWLAARTTAGAIKGEQSQALDDGDHIYTELLSYAAEHSGWQGVQPLVEKLARQTGRRIALSTQRRARIADSAPEPQPLPQEPSTVVDPLAIDPSLVPTAATDRISTRAVGPFRLPKSERERLHALAERALRCVRNDAGHGSIEITPSGRPRIQSPDRESTARCTSQGLSDPTPTERKALGELNELLNDCLARKNLKPVRLRLDMSWNPIQPGTWAPSAPEKIGACLGTVRREQLTPYVAGPALLFVTTRDEPAAFDLSSGNLFRLVGLVAAVLLLTVVVTVLAGRRLTRPLRALTEASQRMAGGDTAARVTVSGKDELARLASSFNVMSERREAMESQRKSMVSDIAHELRTPLSNIRGWLEAIEDGVHDPDLALISSLHEEAMLLQHLIDDLQDLAQADAGQLRLHPERVSLAEIFGQVGTAHAERAAAAGVGLTTHSDTELELWADPVRLRQAVDNLVTNAIRHTPAGGTVSVTGREDGGWVRIDVTDTGTGIDADDLPYVFDRFWRAEKSRSRRTGGSGLGLAIARHLAEAHGGTATAAATPGHGSTFTLRLPAS